MSDAYNKTLAPHYYKDNNIKVVAVSDALSLSTLIRVQLLSIRSSQSIELYLALVLRNIKLLK